MSTGDGERWDVRHAESADDHDVKPAPPDALVESGLVDRVPTSGRALDVACGLGAQTIWLARRGLSVVALDASLVAIESLRARVDAADAVDAVDDGDQETHDDALTARLAGRIDARQHDLDDGLPPGEPFDVIVCQRFRDPLLYPALVERLRPGGLLVITVLSRTGAVDPGPFHAPSGELLAAFEPTGATILHHAQADGQESLVLQTNA